MKSFILSILAILFLSFLQTSFAQKYEYDIEGIHFSDLTQKTILSTKNHVEEAKRKAIFEMPTDETYIYHQVGEGESIEYILSLYQICSPCFAKWNNLDYASFAEFLKQTFYQGEFLKVAIKKEYEKGMPFNYEKRTLYHYFAEGYIYSIAEEYKVSVSDLRMWNNLDEDTYSIGEVTLIVGETEYKYACPCK